MLNWPLIITVFCLTIPGTLIAIPRLIHLFLADNSTTVQKRIGRLAILQTLLMAFLMSIAGNALSKYTGLGAPILESLLSGNPAWNEFAGRLFPAVLISIAGLLVFLVLYYKIAAKLLDEKCLTTLKKMRDALQLDGCMLYGGVVDEVLARWGLLNVIAFFAIMFAQQNNSVVILSAITISSLFYALSQLPAYLAAGCPSNRRFIYIFLLLHTWQSLIFGIIFWQYGLLTAIIAHLIFHLGWYLYGYRQAS